MTRAEFLARIKQLWPNTEFDILPVGNTGGWIAFAKVRKAQDEQQSSGLHSSDTTDR